MIWGLFALVCSSLFALGAVVWKRRAMRQRLPRLPIRLEGPRRPELRSEHRPQLFAPPTPPAAATRRSTPPSWRVVAWKANGGYGSVSPYCLHPEAQQSLFAIAGGAR